MKPLTEDRDKWIGNSKSAHPKNDIIRNMCDGVGVGVGVDVRGVVGCAVGGADEVEVALGGPEMM